ncbi:MAG: imidazole glycerol phosphate synthase subunit HisF [Alphaproteobacteria bacterium TMED62]|nr:MAG: imidazole glycerol phosphate synthase subunit HisF [Alphaproteobacteria bacterium TMED62]|tara:strand:+ start:1512 stop:2270 length:759 start_codon:yes stop_codon:yes gene_type:complete
MISNPVRVIARLDIKSNSVVKGINLEGLRKVGDPKELAKKYYKEGIDEIIYMDVVASLYERNTIEKFIKVAAKEIFVPLTVGGGIRNLEDIRKVLNNGADKVAINTAAIKNENFIKEASQEIGSQSIIVSIEAKKVEKNNWEAYYDNGRERSGLNVLDWAKKAQDLGAGEVLITSVDNEGLKKGMDLELLKRLRDIVSIPIIFSGGVGQVEHIIDVVPNTDAVALASVLHYNEYSIKFLKDILYKKGINVRS